MTRRTMTNEASMLTLAVLAAVNLTAPETKARIGGGAYVLAQSSIFTGLPGTRPDQSILNPRGVPPGTRPDQNDTRVQSRRNGLEPVPRSLTGGDLPGTRPDELAPRSRDLFDWGGSKWSK